MASTWVKKKKNIPMLKKKAENIMNTRQSVACNARRHPVFEYQNT